MAISTNETTNFTGQVQGSLTSAGEVHTLNLDFTENAGQATGSVEGVTQDLSNADLTSNIANFTGQLKGTITTLGNVHTLNCNIDFGDLSQMGIYNFSLDLSKYLEQQVVEKDYYAVATLLGNGPVLDTNPAMQASTSVLAFDIKTFGGANTTAKINLEMTFATKAQGEGGGETPVDPPVDPPVEDKDLIPLNTQTVFFNPNKAVNGVITMKGHISTKKLPKQTYSTHLYKDLPSGQFKGDCAVIKLTRKHDKFYDILITHNYANNGDPEDRNYFGDYDVPGIKFLGTAELSTGLIQKVTPVTNKDVSLINISDGIRVSYYDLATVWTGLNEASTTCTFTEIECDVDKAFVGLE